jgi:hypothetical protein
MTDESAAQEARAVRAKLTALQADVRTVLAANHQRLQHDVRLVLRKHHQRELEDGHPVFGAALVVFALSELVGQVMAEWIHERGGDAADERALCEEAIAHLYRHLPPSAPTAH